MQKVIRPAFTGNRTVDRVHDVCCHRIEAAQQLRSRCQAGSGKGLQPGCGIVRRKRRQGFKLCKERIASIDGSLQIGCRNSTGDGSFSRALCQGVFRFLQTS